MLNGDRNDFRICRRAVDLRAGAVHSGSDLGLHALDRQAGVRGPRTQPGDLAVKVGTLVVRRDPRTQAETVEWTLKHSIGAMSTFRLLIRIAGAGNLPSRNHR
jgi:hypothetical protein